VSKGPTCIQTPKISSEMVTEGRSRRADSMRLVTPVGGGAREQEDIVKSIRKRRGTQKLEPEELGHKC
jgi:hypothetical protein